MIRSQFLAPLLTACALQLALPTTATAQTTQASADETARARELFRQGAAAMKDGKFQDARKALLQVWTLRHSYDVAAVLGQAELELKAYRDAAEHLDAIADATRECPPARGPCVFAGVVFPCIVVLGHRLAHSTWHWAKAVAEQVNAR